LQAGHVGGEVASQSIKRNVDNADIKQNDDKAQSCGGESATLIAAHGHAHREHTLSAEVVPMLGILALCEHST